MSHIRSLQSGQQEPPSRNCRGYRRKVINELAALALLVAAASGAEAQDTKVFPGLMCVQGFPEPRTRIVVQPTSEGAVLNTAEDTSAIVLCPIVRDVPSVRYQALRVVVLDQNPDPNENVDCIVTSVVPEGTPPFVLSEIIGFTNPPAVGNVNESLERFEFRRPIERNPGGPLFLRCIIPRVSHGRQSGIYSYTIDVINRLSFATVSRFTPEERQLFLFVPLEPPALNFQPIEDLTVTVETPDESTGTCRLTLSLEMTPLVQDLGIRLALGYRIRDRQHPDQAVCHELEPPLGSGPTDIQLLDEGSNTYTVLNIASPPIGINDVTPCIAPVGRVRGPNFSIPVFDVRIGKGSFTADCPLNPER